MAQNSAIEWTDHTANYWEGCTKVSAGCKHCYAEARARRWKHDVWGPTASRRLGIGVWGEIYRWDREAAAKGIKARVFSLSLGDFWEGPETCQNDDAYRMIEDARRRVCEEVIPNTPNLIHLLLTKRPENILRFAPASWQGGFPANVAVGTSVEDQAAADERIPHLLRVPASVRFLSCEPLLGPVELSNLSGWKTAEAIKWLGRPILGLDGIHWVIVGGESGPSARICDLKWVRSLVAQCQGAGAPVFVKQLGDCVYGKDSDEWTKPSATRLEGPRGLGWHFHPKAKKAGDINEWPEDLRVRQLPAQFGAVSE